MMVAQQIMEISYETSYLIQYFGLSRDAIRKKHDAYRKAHSIDESFGDNLSPEAFSFIVAAFAKSHHRQIPGTDKKAKHLLSVLEQGGELPEINQKKTVGIKDNADKINVLIERTKQILEDKKENEDKVAEVPVDKEIQIDFNMDKEVIPSVEAPLPFEVKSTEPDKKEQRTALQIINKVLLVSAIIVFFGFLIGMLLGQAFISASLEQRLFARFNNYIPFNFAFILFFMFEASGVFQAATFTEVKTKFSWINVEEMQGRKIWIWLFFAIQVVIDFCFFEIFGQEVSAIIGSIILGIAIPLGIASYSVMLFKLWQLFKNQNG